MQKCYFFVFFMYFSFLLKNITCFFPCEYQILCIIASIFHHLQVSVSPAKRLQSTLSAYEEVRNSSLISWFLRDPETLYYSQVSYK